MALASPFHSVITYGRAITRSTTTGIPWLRKFWMMASWSAGRYGCSLTQLVACVYDGSPTATRASFGDGPVPEYTLTPAVVARARIASRMFNEPYSWWK
jgi:hypothetical protein